jgi:hypothetical protein
MVGETECPVWRNNGDHKRNKERKHLWRSPDESQ